MNIGRSTGTGYWWLFIRIVLATTFIYAGLSKIFFLQDFSDIVASYHILPAVLINPIALTLPPFEFICGLSMLTGIYPRVATLGISISLLLFMAAIIAVIARGLSIDCGCFGPLAWLEISPWTALFRDGLLLIIAIIFYRHLLYRPKAEIYP